MKGVSRIGVSLEPGLLKSFDKLIKKKGYTNRSEAIRDIIREKLASEKAADKDTEVIGTIIILFDHHSSAVVQDLLELQHHVPTKIFSTLHVHVDEHLCMEIIALKGKRGDVTAISDKMGSIKGVLQSHVFVTTPEY